MSFHSWVQNLRSALTPRQGQRQHARRRSLRAATYRLHLEPLEDRRLLAFLAPVDYGVGSNPQDLATADFTNDGRPDLAVVNTNDSTVGVLVGSDTVPGTFNPMVTSPTGTTPKSMAVGDFNDDGKMDVATANAYDVSVLLGDGTGALAPAPGGTIALRGNPESVAVGDFNGDGKMDLGVTSNVYHPAHDCGYDCYRYPGYPASYESYATVLLGNGLGGFSDRKITFLDDAFHENALAADLNGDQYDDFVTFNLYAIDYVTGYVYATGYVSVLLGASSGFLRSPSLIYTGNSSYGLDTGDVDGDGDNDLVTASTGWSVNIGVLLNNGSGSFFAPVNYAVGVSSSEIVLGDFTHDGHLDVMTTSYSSDQVSVLHGGAGGVFSTPVHSQTGNPWAIAAGDFNGDGWLDAATASIGGHNVSMLINDHSWPSPPPPPPTVSINDPAAVLEGNTGSADVTFTLTLSHAYDEDVTVHYATADITAAAGSDYTAASGDVVIPAGQTSRTFTVAVKGDRLVEPTETFAVNFSAPNNATIGDGQGIGTILDNEPRVSMSDVAKKEGKKGNTTLFTFTVTLSAAYDQAVTMSFATANGTATTSNGDYVAKSGTFTFNPGQTTKTITIEVKGDSNREASEKFYLDLLGLSSNALFTKNRGIGTILNDD